MSSLRESYEKNSPFYCGLILDFGPTLTRSQATVVAAEHYLSLADLGYPESQQTFGTLKFVMDLGY